MYKLVVVVDESCTRGTIVSRERIPDASSLSSGALADHSGLSSEFGNSTPSFALPCQKNEDLSVSTSSSSGLLSVSKGHQNKPCFSRVRLVCDCGCDLTSARLTSGGRRMHEEMHEADGVTPEHSDMDLTNPIIASVANPELDEPDVNGAGPGQDDAPSGSEPAESFPRIRLSLRPTCHVEPQNDVADETPVRPLWDWTRNVLNLFCSPERLDPSERLPQIPSHWAEDEHSVFFHMCWMVLTEQAREDNQPPPCLPVRIFFDPANSEGPAHPKEYLANLGHMSDTEIGMIYEDFLRVREIAFRKFPYMRPNRFLEDDLRRSESCDIFTGSDAEYIHDDDMPELQPVLIENEPPAPAPRVILPSFTPLVGGHKRSIDVGSTRSPSPPAKRPRLTPSSPSGLSTEVASTSTTKEAGILFVYARCDKWYYPGVLRCTLDEWDSAVEPLNVTYFDAQEKQLPPDQIFPVGRLPPGAQVQRQTSECVYEDVHFLSCTTRTESASFLVQDLETGSTEEVEFSLTALSPKDVMRLRSALKSDFYPSRIRQNFTEVSQGAILSSAKRRTRTQNPEPAKTTGSKSKTASKKQASRTTAAAAATAAAAELGPQTAARKRATRQPSFFIPPYIFAKPSTSGISPGPSARFVPSDSDTDTTSPARKWFQPSGSGLQSELVVLGDTAKSFTGLKTARKNEAKTRIFDGLHFVLTKGVDSKGGSGTPKRRSTADSESESTDNENYYYTSIKFEVPVLQRAIEVGGGRLYVNLSNVPFEIVRGNPNSVVLLSNHPCTTANYIQAAAQGLTILRHDTILECSRKGMALSAVLKAGSAMYLSPGWDVQRNCWAPLRTSKVAPLRYNTILTVVQDTAYWHTIIRHLGGRALEWLTFRLSAQPDICCVVADEPLPEEKQVDADGRGLPVVSTRWLIQAAINGGKPPFVSYPVTSPPSSS